MEMQSAIMSVYEDSMTGRLEKTDPEYNSRIKVQYSPRTDSDSVDSSQVSFLLGDYPYKCGALRDYSKY